MPTGDNVLRDPIPDGIFDHAYRIRAFVTVPDFAGWRPEDEIHIMGIECGDAGASIADLPGIYLKANRLHGTHALTEGMAIAAGVRYCVETAITVNGADGTIDQVILVEGVEVGAVESATPGVLSPPSAAVAGVSASTNTQIAILLGSPVWNTEPIGCGQAQEGTGDPIYPGEPGYPFLPSDDFFGEPYFPPDTTPLVPGMPGYPYAPDDPRYGGLYFPPPPTGTGSSGTVAVSITSPLDGTTVSDDPLLIQVQTLELSPTGGVPVVEIWVDSRRVGDAYGDPRVFFWEWFGTKPGAHQIRAVAKATSGARVYSAPITVYIPDIAQPDLAFLAPPTGEPVAGLVDVAVEAADNVDVVDVSIYVDDTTLLGTITRPPYRVTLDTSTLSEGVHTLKAVARDPSGNIAEATRAIEIGELVLEPWQYATMAALPPPLRFQVDFANDPFVAPLSTAILGSQPWAYLPLDEDFPEESVFTEDLTGNVHSGRLFGTWDVDGGGFRTTAMRTSGIVIPAPIRRPAFTFAALLRPRSFGESFPMRLLDTGGLRFLLAADGSLSVEGALSTGPGIVPAGPITPKHVALIYDAGVPSVGTTTSPTPPSADSYMAIVVEGEIVASKSPLTVADTRMMARSTTPEWIVGGGAGDLSIDEIALWMRPVDVGEIGVILETRYNPPSAPEEWTDVTEYVRGPTIETSRGKYGEAEHAEPGTMILTLDNADRRFEPEYEGSPYFPGVTTNRKIRMQAFHGGEWLDVWRGYVLRWPQSWGVRRSLVTIECVGNLVRFGHADKVSGDFPAELTGARLDRVLDAAAVPTSERLLDRGKLLLAGRRVERSNARGYADQAVDSEFGVMFEDASGRIVFHDRDHRSTDARSVVPQFVLGDGGPASGELPLVDAQPDQDEDRVLNDVRVEWPGGVTQVAVDGASVRRFGRKDIVLQTILGSEASAIRLARTVLDLSAWPRWRFPSISIHPSRLDRLWDVALRTEISDRLVIRRKPPSGGAVLEIPVHVEAIMHSIEVGAEGRIANWITTFATSTIGRAEPVALVPSARVVAPPAAATASRSAPTLARVSNPTILARPATAIAEHMASTPGFAAATIVAPPAAAIASAGTPGFSRRTISVPPAAATAAGLAPTPRLRVFPPTGAATAPTSSHLTSPRTVRPPAATAYALRGIPQLPKYVVAPARNAIASRAAPVVSIVDNETRILAPPAIAVASAPVEPPFGDGIPVLSTFTGADETPLSEGGNWAKMDASGPDSLRRIGNAVGSASAGQYTAYWTPTTFGPNVDVFATISVKPENLRRVSLFARVTGAGGTDTFDAYEHEAFIASGTDEWALYEITDFGIVSYDTIAFGNVEWGAGDKIGLRCYGDRISAWRLPNGSSQWVKLGEVVDTTRSGSGHVAMSVQNTTARLDDFAAGTITAGLRVIVS